MRFSANFILQAPPIALPEAAELGSVSRGLGWDPALMIQGSKDVPLPSWLCWINMPDFTGRVGPFALSGISRAPQAAQVFNLLVLSRG